MAAALAFADASFPHPIEILSDSALLWLPRKPAWQRITGSPDLAPYVLPMLARRGHRVAGSP